MSNIRLKLGYTQYIKNCSTEKAYAIRFSRFDDNMIFISKKHSTLTEVVSKENNRLSFDRYELEFPLWLYDRLTDSQKDSIKLIIQENAVEFLESRENEKDRIDRE